MKLQLINKYQETSNAVSFVFTSKDIKTWQAGQYLNITMPDIPPVNADRIFTIASAPHEGHILITTIITDSNYKKKMNSLNVGDLVEVDQLGGDFVWQDDGRPKLYLAGGIGSTTYRSIILDRLHKNLPNNSVLLYAGRPSQRPFLEEFSNAQKQDKSLKVYHFEDKRLTFSDLTELAPDFAKRTVYLAGSQNFVESFGEELQNAGALRENLKYDWFDGYTSLE